MCERCSRVLTDEELIELGRWVRQHKEGGFMVDGRPMTNIEMLATLRLANHEKETMVACDECESPLTNGACSQAMGMCHFFLRAQKILGST